MLVHLVNLSGAAQVAYHPAIPMNGISVGIQGNYANARLASSGRALQLKQADGYARFTIPVLDTYEVVVLT